MCKKRVRKKVKSVNSGLHALMGCDMVKKPYTENSCHNFSLFNE